MKRFIRALGDDNIEVYLSTDHIVEVFEDYEGDVRVGSVTKQYYKALDFKKVDELVDYIEERL